MTAQIIDGNQIANNLRKDIAIEVKKFIKKGLNPPGLAVILVGDNPASAIYVAHKNKDCAEVGFLSKTYKLPYSATQNEILELIDELNLDPLINGILVQLPLPNHLNSQPILERIGVIKDVDGFHPYNIGHLVQGFPTLSPCTPKGVMHMLRSTNCNLVGLDALVIGASNIVGKPMALELLKEGCTVTIAHSRTKDLISKIAQADLLVVAVGRENLVKGSQIKPNAIVIDVGINRMHNGKLCGDVEFNEAIKVASWITPVPGGVGPMTRACLLENTLTAYKLQNKQ